MANYPPDVMVPHIAKVFYHTGNYSQAKCSVSLILSSNMRNKKMRIPDEKHNPTCYTPTGRNKFIIHLHELIY
jgi:hypothetical protein